MFSEVCQRFDIMKTRTLPLHSQFNEWIVRFHNILQCLQTTIRMTGMSWFHSSCTHALLHTELLATASGYWPLCCCLAVTSTFRVLWPFHVHLNIQLILRQVWATWQHALNKSVLWLEDNSLKPWTTWYPATTNITLHVPGVKVWLYNPTYKKGRSLKLQRNWDGPFTVVCHLNDVVHRIWRSFRARSLVIHRNHLAVYRRDICIVKVFYYDVLCHFEGG